MVFEKPPVTVAMWPPESVPEVAFRVPIERLRAPLNVPPLSVTSGSVVAGGAPSSVSVPLSSVSAAGSSVAPPGSVTLAVVRTWPAPPIRPVTVRMPAKVSSESATNVPVSVPVPAASERTPLEAWTVPSLSSSVETVLVPPEVLCRRPPETTWIWPLPLLQTKLPAPVPIVKVASIRNAAEVMTQMSPPVHVESAWGRKLMLSSSRIWPPVAFVNVPVTVAVCPPDSVPDVAMSVPMVRLRAPLNVPPDSVTSGSVVAGVAPSSVSVPLSSVSAAGSSVAPPGSVTLAVVRTWPAPPIRPVTVRMPAKVSSDSARNVPVSVATAGAAATDSVPCAAWTVPSLSSSVEIVEVPGESFSSRPPAATWTWPLPLLQTKFPPPVAIVNVASRRMTPPVMTQMSPPFHVEAAPTASVPPSIRSCALVVLVSVPAAASVPEPVSVPERRVVAPETVSVRAPPVCRVPPSSTSVAALEFWSSTTLSPEPSVTSSAPVGTWPHDQLPGALQLPDPL